MVSTAQFPLPPAMDFGIKILYSEKLKQNTLVLPDMSRRLEGHSRHQRT